MLSKLKIISLIGRSGSGKTNLIINAIKRLRKELHYNIAVIKNIHEHQIDEEGKDSYRYIEAGANYAITKNIYNETTLFVKKEINFSQLINWISSGPFKIDLIFTEGFRTLNHPTILCVKEFNEIESQLTKNVKMISGLITKEDISNITEFKLPIIDIEKDFVKFLNIFDIKQ